uniref:heavy-metal-associated domain-containing protein n=1 Tax=Ndongobacter massiliensis TaxID=1871025 RepID=UPI000931F20F|nr:heavy metal-associated domain-containing protein [Ndongobacter massiliensis]
MLWNKKESGPRYEIGVEGMHCDHCAAHIAQALRNIPGVESAKVDRKAKKATVHAPKGMESALEKAITDTGYECTGVTYVEE